MTRENMRRKRCLDCEKLFVPERKESAVCNPCVLKRIKAGRETRKTQDKA